LSTARTTASIEDVTSDSKLATIKQGQFDVKDIHAASIAVNDVTVINNNDSTQKRLGILKPSFIPFIDEQRLMQLNSKEIERIVQIYSELQ
jgi:hypothetical protein